MRIIGGKFRGRRIIAPKGMVSRPTADRTREALFNILTARDDLSFDGARVLDTFAGSGALGLEALSRGAGFCIFTDTDAGARAAIRDNIEALGLFGCARIQRRSAAAMGDKPAGAGAPFDLAFLDPPYGENLCEPAINSLITGGWLAPGAVIIVEQGKNEPPAIADGVQEQDRRIYGAAQIGVYKLDK